MKSSAWQNEDGLHKPKGKPIWLQVVIAFSTGLLIFLVAIGLQTRNNRLASWEGFRNVMAEIKTESDAKELFRRSPDLMTRFPNETQFWEYLQSYQSVIQIPPNLEPVNDGERYLVFPMPTSTSIRFRFEDGTTFSIGIKSPGFFRSFPKGQEVLQHFDIKAARMLKVQKQ